MSPKAASIVAFSNQPYILYHNEEIIEALVKAQWFAKGGSVSISGPALTAEDGKGNVAILLDHIAQYLHSIVQGKKTLKETPWLN